MFGGNLDYTWSRTTEWLELVPGCIFPRLLEVLRYCHTAKYIHHHFYIVSSWVRMADELTRVSGASAGRLHAGWGGKVGPTPDPVGLGFRMLSCRCRRGVADGTKQVLSWFCALELDDQGPASTTRRIASNYIYLSYRQHSTNSSVTWMFLHFWHSPCIKFELCYRPVGGERCITPIICNDARNTQPWCLDSGAVRLTHGSDSTQKADYQRRRMERLRWMQIRIRTYQK